MSGAAKRFVMWANKQLEGMECDEDCWVGTGVPVLGRTRFRLGCGHAVDFEELSQILTEFKEEIAN